MAEKNYFYELGRKSGATTGVRKSGAQALVDKLSTTVGSMLQEQQNKTAKLMADMPQGVDILKLDERVRGKVTDILTKNKKLYTEAAKVVASGINPSSERYRNAIETMNKVNSVFENMSSDLEGMALGRQDALNRLDKLANNSDSTRLTVHHKLANGSIYDDVTFNEDGTANYVDGKNETVKWSDYKKIGDQKFTGVNGVLSMVENARKQAGQKGANSWENVEQDYANGIKILFGKMGQEEVLDFIFSDKDFVEEYAKKRGLDADFLKRNPQGDIAGEGKYDIVADFKAQKLKDVENAWINTPKYSEGYRGTAVDYDKMVKSKQVEKNFNTFMTPPTSSTGAGRTPVPEMPTPEEQINWFNTNINRNKTVKFNPVDKETNKVQKGYYEVIKYNDGSEEFKLISPGINLRWEDMSLLIDYNQIARTN